jgi:hypothetical protein
VLSLIKANRQILKANQIAEHVDDFIYMTVVLKRNLIDVPETQTPPKPTPV